MKVNLSVPIFPHISQIELPLRFASRFQIPLVFYDHLISLSIDLQLEQSFPVFYRKQEHQRHNCWEQLSLSLSVYVEYICEMFRNVDKNFLQLIPAIS
ncbi:hypothetical protein T10_4722 [Trichinella papuae]|uniref:Uncharacterized protein n=1 Tax=Trichinella papuae TaxID=268474 RepID=A0A0V1MD56_9BILA|nr:hypothetical protein T10_4722 [Trichinella papuae]